VLTDSAGYILTGTDLGGRPDGWALERDPLPLETSRPGLFAAGDVRHGSTKRVGAAVGEGAMAAALFFRRLNELGLTV
jgi:thioredoxin reductase (NADPH)